MHPQDIAYFLIVTVGFKLIVGGVLTDILRRALKKWLLHTERDFIIWAHYKMRAAKRGHAPRHPLNCEDDDCTKVTR